MKISVHVRATLSIPCQKLGGKNRPQALDVARAHNLKKFHRILLTLLSTGPKRGAPARIASVM